MREMKLLIYSTIAFMLYFMLAPSFVTLMYPEQEIKTVTVKKIYETTYYFTPDNHTVTGKFYNEDGYFLVVYNEDTKDFDIEKVEEMIWKKNEIRQDVRLDNNPWY